MTWRDLKVRYKQTVLGVSWAVFEPFLTMVVFTIFFLVRHPTRSETELRPRRQRGRGEPLEEDLEGLGGGPVFFLLRLFFPAREQIGVGEPRLSG